MEGLEKNKHERFVYWIKTKQLPVFLMFLAEINFHMFSVWLKSFIY